MRPYNNDVRIISRYETIYLRSLEEVSFILKRDQPDDYKIWMNGDKYCLILEFWE